ncbi:hypothetical protein BCR33DRAFT_783237 [Rhizoclosmatium globosum]|uniref:Uncharacterized protein n=1 Tax=Rhizoclosmatium globosum TaxID=329046 RepID=A0A1Y2CIU6_9FUNG|nr:hypothetical protein BCR33DRAFT_783237 [Rhizoclosmatium globosum]|eukprot:ORY46754.1 hypothetical protein BCR33DRAFT_783237 [Rhizoclosmatium globosum]
MTPPSSSSTTKDLRRVMPSILSQLPSEWRGTTFANKTLLGRSVFAERVLSLVSSKVAKCEEQVTSTELSGLGVAEDYFRVSSNVSVLLELALASDAALKVDDVLSFASVSMPVIAVLLTATLPVVLYVQQGTKAPFSAAHVKTLALLGADLTVVSGVPKQQEKGKVVVAFRDSFEAVQFADAVVAQSTLYILNKDKSRAMMSWSFWAGIKVTADTESSTPAALAEFYAHLQTMSGTTADPTANPVVFTAGLPAICATWLALLTTGGADILMASTAYPTTVLFVEIPTNPDMKVPDMAVLARHLETYAKTTKSKSSSSSTQPSPRLPSAPKNLRRRSKPHNNGLHLHVQKRQQRPHNSRNPRRKLNSSPSRALLSKIREIGSLLDTTAKRDQLYRLTSNHIGVETRCLKAYTVAASVGSALVASIHRRTSHKMDLAFVHPNKPHKDTQPPHSHSTSHRSRTRRSVNRDLAQRFGQDNGVVYATVPATSTQGAIKEEDKAKQLVGGVELTRLSFAPGCDVGKVVEAIEGALDVIYGAALMFAQKPFQNWIESEGMSSLSSWRLSHDVNQPEMIKAILSGDMRPFMPLFYDKHRIGKTLFHILDTVQADKSISLIVTATSLGFISPYIYHYSNVPTCTVHLIPTGQPTSQIPSS